MPGSRYTDWTHTHVVGSREDAAPYVSAARKLLGFVFQEAARQGLGSYKLRQKLSDGTIIVAEKIGTIPRMTITPPPRAVGTSQASPPEEFVVWARDTLHSAGIDDEHPQQILKPTWQTFFFDGEVQGYVGFNGRKGTYKTGASGVVIFPEGIRHAGNVDWEGPNRERVSWYGPSSRYFFDPYVQPRRQYGKLVFLLGQVLLDVDQYIVESAPDPAFDERFVMGAAIDALDLYVVLANLPVGETLTGTAPPDTVVVPSPWPLDDVVLTLCRFGLSIVEGVEDAMRFRVVPQSREVVWTASIARALQPWFFNASCTELVSAGLPETVNAATNGGVLAAAPSTSNLMHRITIDDEGAASYTSHTVSLQASPSEATIAADYKGDVLVELIVRRAPIAQTIEGFALKLGDATYPLISERELTVGNPNVQEVDNWHLIHADLRKDVLVFLHGNATLDFSFGTTVLSSSAQIEVMRGGAAVRTIPVPFDDMLGCGLGANFGTWTRAYREATAGELLAPLFPLYAIYSGLEAPTTRFVRWQGAHGLYQFRPYPIDHDFGAYAVRAATPGALIPIATLTDAGFDGSQVDFDTHYSVVGAASTDKTTLLSCYGFLSGGGRTLHCVAGEGAAATLPQLTGVDGDLARFHPIWRLGDLPRLLA